MTGSACTECRVVEGLHRIPFIRFTSVHTSRRCELDESMVMIGASFEDEPVGLAVLQTNGAGEPSNLESIFVEPGHRRRGVGRELLGAVESSVGVSGASKVVGSWYHDAAGAEPIQRLLADAGWTAPEAVSTRHQAGRRFLEQVDRASRPWRPRPGLEIEPWSALTPGDRRCVARLCEDRRVPTDLHPLNDSMFEISERTSVLLRLRDEIAGWMIHHVLAPELLRYSSLWIRPDLVGHGLGISLAIESGRRHLATAGPAARLSFAVSRDNEAMRRFVDRRLRAAVDRSSTMLYSEARPIGPRTTPRDSQRVPTGGDEG